MIYPDHIITGDCLADLPGLPQESADIVIADPPYNIGKNFGNNKDQLPLADYVAWAEKWLAQCLRILKKHGTIFIYGFPEILAHISVTLPLQRQRWLQWHYTNKNMPGVNFWQRSHESILCVWKGKPIFNRDAVREPYTAAFIKGIAGRKRAAGSCRLSRKGTQETVYKAHSAGALPRDVIAVSSLSGGAARKERNIYCKSCSCLVQPSSRMKHASHELVIHPTQKPRALTAKLIKSAKPAGAFNVLIPFCGSGTECAITRELGGKFIAWDLNPDYVTLANAVTASSPDPVSSAQK